MRKSIFLIAFFSLVGCNKDSLKKNRDLAGKVTEPGRYSSAAQLMGLRHGGSIPDDSSMGQVQFEIGKTATRKEYGLIIWRVCLSGEKLSDCERYRDFAVLDTQESPENKRVIVEAKDPLPGDNASFDLCQTRGGIGVLAWLDYSDRTNMKVLAGWKVQDSVVRWQAISPDSVLCNVNEAEGEDEGTGE